MTQVLNSEFPLGAHWEREITLLDADGKPVLPSEVEVTWSVYDERYQLLASASSTASDQVEVPDQTKPVLILIIAPDRQDEIRPGRPCRQVVMVKTLADSRIHYPTRGTLYAWRAG